MTEQEAIKTLQKEYPLRVFGYEDICDAYDMAISALEKSDRYRWHDLRKDPEDLPGEDNQNDFFMVCVSGFDRNYVEHRDSYMVAPYFYDGTWGSDGLTVNAWREIEPFEWSED